MDCVVVDMHLPNHGLVEEPRHLPKIAAKGNGPLIVVECPSVCSEDRRGCEPPAVREIAGDELLGHNLVHTGPSLSARERPEVIG